MASGDFKDLNRRTASDKVLRDKTFIEERKIFLDMLFYRSFTLYTCKRNLFHSSMALKTLLTTFSLYKFFFKKLINEKSRVLPGE